MSDFTDAWLKRDPTNELLVGPDGCHYANEQQAAHYALLKLCGCGHPVRAYNFCRDALGCFDRRGGNEWIDAEAALEQLVLARPSDAAHVLAHLFIELDLLEHGSSVVSSWLTRDGERVIDMGAVTQETLDQSM